VTLLEALTATPQTKRVLAEKLGTSSREVELEVQDARLRGVPIISDSDGYRYAQTPQEARQCAARLRSRAIRQMETAQALDRAADKMPLSLWNDAA
jgi:biotin operon repressor